MVKLGFSFLLWRIRKTTIPAIININATDPTIIPIKASSLNSVNNKFSNIYESVNVFEDVFDSVNVCVGQERQSSMVVPSYKHRK